MSLWGWLNCKGGVCTSLPGVEQAAQEEAYAQLRANPALTSVRGFVRCRYCDKAWDFEVFRAAVEKKP